MGTPEQRLSYSSSSTTSLFLQASSSDRSIYISTAGPSPLQGLVSDQARRIFQAVNFAVIAEIICIFGTVTNVINIVVFVKQGFNDPVNVTLLGLAISDIGCLVTLIWMNLCFNPLFQESDVPMETLEIQYITGGWPHVIFARVTSWITAFITAERCLCITMPLKVKTIITPKRVTIFIVCSFIVLIAMVSPVFYCNRIGWKFYPDRNRTLLGLIYTDNREEIETITFAINNICIPFVAFAVVIMCTTILVIKLRSKAKWRQKSTAPGKSDSLSARDDKVARMVVMISVLFIICFIPICIIFLGMMTVPEFSVIGRYRNIFFIVSSFAFIMESTNSSMNIFIYYHMSSKYRTVFRQVFGMDKKT